MSAPLRAAHRMLPRLSLLAALAGCASSSIEFPRSDDTEPRRDDTDSEDTDTTGDTGDTDAPAIIVGEMSVAPNPANPFSALVTVTVDHDADVWVAYGEGATDHETPRVRARAGEPTQVVVLGLRAERDFDLLGRAEQGASNWTSRPEQYTTPSLDRDWPECTPTFHAPESEFDDDEVVCTNMSSPNGALWYGCVDRWGTPVHTLRTDDNDSLMSMRKLRAGGWASTSLTSSKLAFFDETSAQIAQLGTPWLDGRARFQHDWIDSHEIYEVPGGTWEGQIAFITATTEWMSDGSYKNGNGIVVMDPALRTVLYDYSFHGVLGDEIAMDDAVPYDRPGYGDYYEDWNHANTLITDVDADGRDFFLVSLKSQDWIVKLYPDTDSVAWRLGYGGDFTLVDDIDAASPRTLDPTLWPYHQHGITFVERLPGRYRLLMYDNGVGRIDAAGNQRWDLAKSRAIVMDIDETTMLAEVVWQWPELEDARLFSDICGNAELLPDDDAVLVLDGAYHHVTEVSYPAAERRWEMTCGSVEVCSYRMRYAPDLYSFTWDDR